MPSQQPQQQEKIPWPGDWAIFSAGANNLGLSNDTSGIEAINYWAQDKSQEEINVMLKRAESLGFVTGFFGSLPLWSRFWSWFFGSNR